MENQENVSNLVIDDTELKQVAYIYKCVNTTLQIKGKINSITVDNCKKLGLVFDDVVGIVEIINSRDVKQGESDPGRGSGSHGRPAEH